MTRKETFESSEIPAGFSWLGEIPEYCCENGLAICVSPGTDFWQRTHYGFCRDNGHFLFIRQTGDFEISGCVSFTPNTQYDQCGLMIREDEEHWIKVSTEHENRHFSRLGSVVTNRGYSDWATQDIPSCKGQRWYRVSRCCNDFLLETSEDGFSWKQLRITHLHQCGDTLQVGFYACCPLGEGFRCMLHSLEIDSNRWISS